jgi:hypothetical protein
MAELLDQNPDELLALADKHDPELSEIIVNRGKVIADFLRTAREADLTDEEIEDLTEQIRKRKK